MATKFTAAQIAQVNDSLFLEQPNETAVLKSTLTQTMNNVNDLIDATPEPVDVAIQVTTGFISATGVNNVSSVPTTFIHPLGMITEDTVVSQWSLMAGYADGFDDISGADFSLVFISTESGLVVLDTVSAPSNPTTVTTLDPEYTTPENGLLAVRVAGLADGAKVTFKADAVATAA